MNKSSDVCCTNTCQNTNNEKVSENITNESDTLQKFTFQVNGIDCSSCATTIEKALLPLDDVYNPKVNFSTGKLTAEVSTTDTTNQIVKTVEKLGYGIQNTQSQSTQTTFIIKGMDCGNCAKTVEKHVLNLPYVKDAQVNFSTGKLQASMDGQNEKNIIKEVAKIGYTAILQNNKKDNDQKLRLFIKPIISAAFILLGLLMSITSLPIEISNILYTVAILVSGLKPFKSAFYSLKSKSLDMNVLMTVAVIGAMLIGEFFEGAIVIFLFTIGTLLQTISIDKTRNSIQSLMELTPNTANLYTQKGIISKDLHEIHVGDIILVKPGERIPLDGTITEGTSSLNQSPITGESIPVDKTTNDDVYAGSINENGTLKIKVATLVEDTTLSKIIEMVEAAQENKAPAQAFIDKFSEIYTPVAFVLAPLVMLIPPMLTLGSWGEWFYKGLELLVIACPCALVISTPVAIVTAIGNAAKNGVLIKGGNYLEALGSLNAIAFDKTGTLTEGKPKVTAVKHMERDVQTLLQLALSLEAYSTHPISKAIVDYTSKLNITPKHVSDFENMTGKGIKGKIDNQTVYAGNQSLIETINPKIKTHASMFSDYEKQGYTIIIISSTTTFYGLITIEDPLRENIKATIHQLQKYNIKNTVMLTGDNQETANKIAALAGIRETYAKLMPKDKLSAIEDLQKRGYRVGMVGDGINDAPALAQSDVGIAMGGVGSDTAMQTANIVLMSDNLQQLPKSISISKKAKTIIKQNIYFSVIIKLIAFILVFPGLLTLWLAVLSDTGAAILVILNSLRLLKFKKDKQKAST
ncbi:heavy metal translocating P-type ATPase [Staphylococcus cohnii]|uniref:heavy metal translocating P-type ATPase n=1 Tax=Staphylococcus cohnii TaxID=29382 RepID=UPI000D1C312D|nr:heavy metal translocating P-type ATPase [Staphylococcus cohnii]PTF05309.1 heavy metal translocating P-type ATPase [Staphylococcus cohnii]